MYLKHVYQENNLISAQIPDDIGGRARVSMTSDGCAGTINAVNHLEHIQCKVQLLIKKFEHVYNVQHMSLS